MKTYKPHGLPGRLLVLDGAGGAGKGTQYALLVNRLIERYGTERVSGLHFPRYDSAPYGPMIRTYLDGGYGDTNKVDPYLAGLLYAQDRAGFADACRQTLAAGGIIVIDRYVGSNLAYQGVKLLDSKRREAYLNWQMDLEYRMLNIVREDLLILLHAPAEVSQAAIDRRASETNIADEGRDGHEINNGHMQGVISLYQELVTRIPYWDKIDCLAKDGSMRSRQDISDAIWKIVEPVLA